LRREFNPNYYSIIDEFYKISKIPGVLNTSLNLHGSPISSTLKDICHTFENSGLNYLYLDDKFLIKKRERAIEIVKEKIEKSEKSLEDFDHDEIEGMIADEERELKYDQLKAILISLLTLEGLTYLSEI
jgi:hypothetical protein